MTGSEQVRVWQLVTSRAGRDVDQHYLVCGVGGDGFVLLADGERRRLESPKRKNQRHLVAYELYAEELAEKAAAGGTVRNAEVRSALQRMLLEAGLAAVQPEAEPGLSCLATDH